MKTMLRRALFKRFPIIAACACAMLLAGCNEPEEFVLWAPDGQHALVRGAEAVALVNSAGAIVTAVTGLDAAQPASTLAWMPDSRRVLAVRMVKARDWDEYAPLLGPERAMAVIRAAEELLILGNRFQGEPGKFTDDYPEAHDRVPGSLFSSGIGGEG